MMTTKQRKPPWLRRRISADPEFMGVNRLIKAKGLHTVCQEAECPNRWECFSRRTATFLIMGPSCTRNCRFCAVRHDPVAPPDPDEPGRVADAVQTLNLKYAVITSVTRDDLPDGGASFFAATIHEIRKRTPTARVEVLIPDFRGDAAALETVLAARPDVLNHNIETVSRLYPTVRPEAGYDRSIALLARVKAMHPEMLTKSGIMLGLGETAQEARSALSDLRQARCDILTVGQYLQPSPKQLPVSRFVPPEEFDAVRRTALDMGFAEVASGPLVRSSYFAEGLFKKSSAPKRS